MANHVRQQIREAAIVAATGLTTTGAKVYDSRKIALSSNDNLPCWIVRTEDEQNVIEEMTLGGSAAIQRRDLELNFEGMVRAVEGSIAQNTIDSMIKELEVAVAAKRLFGGLAKDTVLNSIETDIDETGDQMWGAVRVMFTSTYWVARGAPDVAL